MKKISLLFLALLTATFFTVQAADLTGKKKGDKDEGDDAPKLVFTGYPFAFIGSSLKVGFETPLGGSRSICLVGNYTGTEESTIYDVENLSEFGIEAQLRFYLNKMGTFAPLNGVYVSPFAMYHKASFDSYLHYPGSLRESASAFAFGYYFGFQKIAKSGLCINFYGGGSINAPSGDYKDLNAGVNVFSKGVRPRGGIALGFAF